MPAPTTPTLSPIVVVVVVVVRTSPHLQPFPAIVRLPSSPLYYPRVTTVHEVPFPQERHYKRPSSRPAISPTPTPRHPVPVPFLCVPSASSSNERGGTNPVPPGGEGYAAAAAAADETTGGWTGTYPAVQECDHSRSFSVSVSVSLTRRGHAADFPPPISPPIQLGAEMRGPTIYLTAGHGPGTPTAAVSISSSTYCHCRRQRRLSTSCLRPRRHRPGAFSRCRCVTGDDGPIVDVVARAGGCPAMPPPPLVLSRSHLSRH